MSRLERYNSLQNHAWFNRLFKRLNAQEHALARFFIESNDNVSPSEFNAKVVHLFTNDKNRPKNWAIIEELLIACNVS